MSATDTPFRSESVADLGAYRMALIGDALETAARLIVFQGLFAEEAAREGDEARAILHLRAVADALDHARDCYALGRRLRHD